MRRLVESNKIYSLTSNHSQEFSLEIPDKEADAIHSGMSIGVPLGLLILIMFIVKQAVDYILAQPDGKSGCDDLLY